MKNKSSTLIIIPVSLSSRGSNEIAVVVERKENPELKHEKRFQADESNAR